MTNPREEPSGFHSVHPERDLVSNWEVDLANRLEEYLLKICSGEIPEDGHVPINFAEAALLLQGSVQVYSRKVEYLYSLVLRALEFLSEKRQQDQLEHTSTQPETSGSHPVADVENDLFWGLDDVPVEAKNCLDSQAGKDSPFKHLLKPPANLVVLEGDCLDISADGGELESYLLATNDLYQDFILLDPCDAVAVDEFLKGNKAGKGQNGTGTHRSSSTHRSFQSPTRHSGGTAHKSHLRKSQDASLSQFLGPNNSFDFNNNNVWVEPPACENLNDNNWGLDMDERYSEPGDFEDEDGNDPWKPLNPHEPGNLKVKPFRKVKAFKRNGYNSSKGASITTVFPLARLHGAISPELTEIWEMRHHAFERQRESQSPPVYEKLRQSLLDGGHETFKTFCNPNDENNNYQYDGGIPDFGETDFDDLPEHMCMHEDIPLHNEKGDDGAAHIDTNEDFGQDANSHKSLEDLCRSHLDALLASIAETEKQTELASRVLTWKQKIEHNLEEQESCPPFDIHEYGDRILDKLSLEADNGDAMSFGDVVKGQEKYDVARTFSALLQLVNNGDVGLDRSGFDGKSICHTDVNPFHICLLSRDKKTQETQLQVTKKRAKSPTGKDCTKSNIDKSGKEKFPVVHSSSRGYRSNCKLSGKLGTIGGVWCTPEGKRRRRSRFTEPVDLHSAG